MIHLSFVIQTSFDDGCCTKAVKTAKMRQMLRRCCRCCGHGGSCFHAARVRHLSGGFRGIALASRRRRLLLRRMLRRSCEAVAAAERRGCYRKTWLHRGQQHPWNGVCCRKRRFCSGSVIEKGKMICFPLLSQLMQTHLRRKTGRLRNF